MRKLIICALAASWFVILSSGANAFDVVQLTDNSTEDRNPAISGSNVVWWGYDGGDWEIYLWEGGTTTQITNNSTGDSAPAISGSNLVWNAYDGNRYEIHVWQGGSARALASSSLQDRFPAISGTRVVWEGYDGDDWEVYMATAIPVPALSTPAMVLLAGLFVGTAFLLIRKLSVAGA